MANKAITVVTGASRGLGRAAAYRLAVGEHHVVLATARRVQDLGPLRDDIERGGGTVECLPLDVADPQSALALSADISERFGRVDALINNAGISLDEFETKLLELPLTTLQATLETNLFGVLRVTQALGPLLRKSVRGRIVNLSSGLGQLSDMGHGVPAYRISKAALNAVTRILAAELADAGIKVNSVCPGWCRTDMGGSAAPRTPEQGIDTVVWLATLPDDGPTGGFFRDRRPIPW